MLRKLSQFTLLLFFLLGQVAVAKQKRALTHQDYDSWESLSSDKITKNGKWVGYMISPQDGDARLEILPFDNPDKKTIIPRAQGFSFTPDDAFVVGKILPQKDSLRVLKLKKSKKEDMPKDSLFILQLNSGTLEKFPEVKSFDIPEKEGSWIAIHFEKEKPAKKDPADSTAKAEKPKKTEGSKLIVRTLKGDQSIELERVKSYGFSPKGDFLQYVLAEEDTLDNAAIYLLDLKTMESSLLHEGNTSYERVTFSPKSRFLAFVSTNDSSKAKKPYHSIFLTHTSKPSSEVLVAKDSPGILENGRISPDASLKFSEDEGRLFFGVAEDYQDYDYESDTTILDEERVSLDIWGWQDSEIQPMQLRRKSQEEKKSYLAVVDLKDKRIAQLGDRKVDQVVLEDKVERDFALAWTDNAYRREYSWNIQIGRDLYLVDFETGQRTLIEKNVQGFPSISPESNYVTWYASGDSSWVVYDIASKKKINLTKAIPVDFYEELHDSPSLPGSYGSSGWLKGDAAILINDRYDIWKIDPKNPSSSVNITSGEGRKNKIVFRRQVLDREEKSIDPKSPLYLTAFNEVNKESGMYQGSTDGKIAPKKIIMSAHRYFGLNKAKESDEITIQRSTYQENPDLYLGDLSFHNLKKASSLNPQQAQVNWGSVELVDYLANDGTALQGLLFKPESFDASKKYPMMVYFYERNSDGLHNYRAPAPSASTINIPYFVSNDYLVFVPDIKYDLGLPGPSAYNCIIPGVQSIVARGFVDADNMAIQGQSWGGYQVAYLITQTNMFKAAGAGAPVVNMTSAYGGIRWGTGMSRMFQYEQTQSRIGGTLWEKPLYYLENSPLFYMDRVQTPVLIMHNDEDGAVPWYQGIEMFMALKRLNQPAWLLQYNGEDHNLRLRKNRKDLSIRLSQFFDHYLKGAPAPLWMTEGLPAVEKGKTLKYGLDQ
ncbi:prolyl oligopeptidase family serine peptidase [Algoriphagus sp. CAU 1675]|uniref:alpha/beta hydrolase family protein n=1 Tax=Algoriphagus sp. CAU 1675 TaxID=3032597 RepID=UPI0023DB4333|nr:prolyl oligopeptidase family serine peptidase [Algoriphagus sp. CAU 1675]MDF2157009.1 prolyl oligopeptidase family serine peptidase [Algoriphagus sp. CAU 1675]